MSSGVGQKYAVALAQVSTASVAGIPVGYNIRGNGYAKQDAETFAPRFGTGAEGLNDLDIWKTWQMADFSGGSFQDLWHDTTMFSLLKNAVLNPIDKRLYPTPIKVQSTAPAGSRNVRKKSATYKGILYRITNGNGTGLGSVAKYVPATKSWTPVKTDFATAVTGLAVYNNKLNVSIGTSGLWQYDGTTWTLYAAFGPTLICKFGTKLYASGSQGADEGTLYGWDGTAHSFIGYPDDQNKPINDMVVFNSRLYIGCTTGLFAYDGVSITTVLDYRNDEDLNNFKQLVVHEGVLYFQIKNALYKFNGSTIEKIRDFGDYETLSSLDASYGRLWVGTYANRVNTGGGAAVGDALLYYYDGVGFFCYDGTITGVTLGLAPLTTMYYNDGTYKHLIFEINGSSGIADNQIYVYDLSKEFGSGNSSIYNDLEIYTSTFDGGFPYIDKYNDSATLTYEGANTGDTLSAFWRIHDGTSWGSFTSTIGGTFRRLQFKLVLHRVHATSGLSLTSFSLRYVLSPDMKRKWNLTFLNIGTTDQPEELLDGSTETLTAKQKREQIYACRINDVPSIFEDIDTCVLASDPGSGGLTITVDDTSTFPPSGYIKIDNELILYTSKTATTFIVPATAGRGRWGTTAAAHTAGAVVGTAYRVIITKIMNERIVSPNNTDGVMDTAGNPSELTAVLQEV